MASHFECETMQVRFLPPQPKYAPVAQLVEATDLKSVHVWVRVPSGVPNVCPRDGTSIRAGFRNQILWVRLPPRVLGFMVSEAEVVEALVCETSY